MNIISNNCIGGFLYKINKLEYANPFMWSQCSAKDFSKLMAEYSSMDFKDFKLKNNKERTNKEHIISPCDLDCYNIEFSNGIVFYFNHIKFDPNALEPEKRGSNVFYANNEEITLGNFSRRLKRMNEEPHFVFFYKEPRNDKDPTENVKDMIRTAVINNYRLVLITEFKVEDPASKNILILEELHNTPVQLVAEKYNGMIMNFLESSSDNECHKQQDSSENSHGK